MSYDYWDKQEAYQVLVEKSGTVWHKLYTEEKAKRQEIEAKYSELIKIIKKQGLDRANDVYAQTYLQNYAKNWDRL